MAGISAVALLGLCISTGAQPPPQQDHKQQGDQKETKRQKGKKQAQEPRRLAPQDQQELFCQQQERLAQYGEHLDQQQRLAQPQSAQLREQNRMAQYSVQQQYFARLLQQQFLVQSQDRYNYGGDPYFYTPPSFRYSQDGNYGYGGFYIERDDYNYYFRQGFRRGYEDGYGGRYQYGRYSNGRGTILSGVLSVILNFESIR